MSASFVIPLFLHRAQRPQCRFLRFADAGDAGNVHTSIGAGGMQLVASFVGAQLPELERAFFANRRHLFAIGVKGNIQCILLMVAKERQKRTAFHIPESYRSIQPDADQMFAIGAKGAGKRFVGVANQLAQGLR